MTADPALTHLTEHIGTHSNGAIRAGFGYGKSSRTPHPDDPAWWESHRHGIGVDLHVEAGTDNYYRTVCEWFETHPDIEFVHRYPDTRSLHVTLTSGVCVDLSTLPRPVSRKKKTDDVLEEPAE